jgi:hypothetical protein
VYPKVSGLAAWSENCKWYSSLPLDAVVSLFCFHNPLCCFSTTVYCCKCIFRYRLSPETFGYTVVFSWSIKPKIRIQNCAGWCSGNSRLVVERCRVRTPAILSETYSGKASYRARTRPFRFSPTRHYCFPCSAMLYNRQEQDRN